METETKGVNEVVVDSNFYKKYYFKAYFQYNCRDLIMAFYVYILSSNNKVIL